MPALSMIRLTAFLTWMSSNGGVVRFIVMVPGPVVARPLEQRLKVRGWSLS